MAGPASNPSRLAWPKLEGWAEGPVRDPSRVGPTYPYMALRGPIQTERAPDPEWSANSLEISCNFYP